MTSYRFQEERIGYDSGVRVFKNGETEGRWWISSARSLAQLYERMIQAQDLEGGRITMPDGEVIEVPGCPTGHANVRDDYVGGTRCADCQAAW